jgi:hypothetical protein
MGRHIGILFLVRSRRNFGVVVGARPIIYLLGSRDGGSEEKFRVKIGHEVVLENRVVD